MGKRPDEVNRTRGKGIRLLTILECTGFLLKWTSKKTAGLRRVTHWREFIIKKALRPLVDIILYRGDSTGKCVEKGQKMTGRNGRKADVTEISAGLIIK